MEKSAEAIIEWLRARLRSSSSWGEGHKPAAYIEEDGENVDALDEEAMAELHALQPGADAETIAAVFNRAMQRRPRAFSPRRPGGGGATRKPIESAEPASEEPRRRALRQLFEEGALGF